jgi:(p)ppGpp synthase/HD superfamily hydrolase
MLAMACVAAVNAMAVSMAENDAFMRTLEGLPEPERQRRIERRQDQVVAERRHRENLAAIRASRQSRQESGISVAGMVVGAAIFGSTCGQ